MLRSGWRSVSSPRSSLGRCARRGRTRGAAGRPSPPSRRIPRAGCGAAPVLLSCSVGLAYEMDAAHRLEPGSLQLEGRALRDTDSILMVANSYLARGGQGFTALLDTPETGEAGTDLEALRAWLHGINDMEKPRK